MVTENQWTVALIALLYVLFVVVFNIIVRRRRRRREPGMQYTATIVNDAPRLMVTRTYQAFPLPFGWWHSPGFGVTRDPQALVRAWRVDAMNARKAADHD